MKLPRDLPKRFGVKRMAVFGRWVVVVPWGLLLMATGSCERSSLDGRAAVRDSSGIVVWENAQPLWQEGDEWRLSPTPSMTLGAVDGGGPQSFGRVADIATVGDGKVVVVDALANEVRVFTPEGVHERTIGRSGQGPGEFSSVSSVQVVAADTLAVFDRGLRRLSRFLLSGQLVDERDLSQVEYRGELAFINEVELLGGGAVATREARDFSGEGDGVTRDTTHFLVVLPGSRDAVGIDSVPGVWTLRTTYRGRQLFRLQPLTPYPQFAVWSDTLYLTSGEHFEIRKATREGLVGIIRRKLAAPMVLEEDRTQFVDLTLERVPAEERSDARELLEGMPLPERLPAYRKVLVDPDGNVWAERYASPGIVPGPEWDVFTTGGQYLGAVENLDGLDWFEVGRDHVLGVWTDDLDVQYVRVHSLEK